MLPKPPLQTRALARQLTQSGTFHASAGLLPPRVEPQPLPLLYIQREQLTRRVLKCLDSQRAVVLLGPPGYGKSTIASAIINELGWPCVYYRFAADESVLVFLETLILRTTQADDNQNEARYAQALSKVERIQRLMRRPTNVHRASELVVEHFHELSGRRLLLVLDDFHFAIEGTDHEPVVGITEAMQVLATRLPHYTKLLITSRDMISSLKNTRAISVINVRGFLMEETKQFLKLAYPGMNLPNKQIKHVHDKLEGWPLGLTYLVQINPAPSSLEDILTSLYGEQPSYVSLFGELVLQQMTPEDLEFLLTTSVAPELNSHLCNKITGRSDADVILQRLAKQQSTFVFSFPGKRSWYRCHDLFRDILRRKLARDPHKEREALVKASEYYVSQELWQQAISCALDSKQMDRALRLVLDHGEVFYQRAQYDMLLGWIDNLLLEYEHDMQASPWLFFMKGRMLERRGKREEAFDCVERSVHAYEQIGDMRELAKSTNKLGTIRLRQRQYSRAEQHFLRSYNISSQIGDAVGQAQALYSLGDVYWHLGEFARAQCYLQESLRLNRDAKCTEGVAIAEVMLGKLEKAQGRLEAAYSFFNDALHLNRELDNRFGFHVAQSFLGEIALMRGDLDQVLSFCQASLQTAERMANHLGVAINSKLLGQALVLRGDFSAAAEYLDRAREFNEHMHDNRGRAIILTTQASIECHAGHLKRAAVMLAEAVRLTRQTSDSIVLGEALINLAEVQARQDNFDRSEECLFEAKQIFDNLGGGWYDALVRRTQGMLERQRKSGHMGIPDLQWALDKFGEIGATYELARTELEITASFIVNRNKVSAIAHLRSAQNLISDYGFGYLKRELERLEEKVGD